MTILRQAVRQLARTPGFSATVILVLALGVGATTAIFSVVHAVLLTPFPYVRGNDILFIGSTRLGQGDGNFMSVTYPDFLDWRANATGFDELAYATGTAATLTNVDEPTVVRNAALSASAWPLLGIQPVLGRYFTAEDDRPAATPVCVLSHALWQGKFNGDPGILQRAITIDGRPYQVIGVMPATFKFWAGDVWTPVGLQADTDLMRSRVLRMDAWVVGRARIDKTIEEVTTELNGIAAQLGLQYPDTNKDTGVFVRRLAENVSGPFRDPLLILLGAVACVLLIACANVANLLLARTAARQREYAVRAALGASRKQLIRQMLFEVLPLALGGGLAGVIIGMWGLKALLLILPTDAVPAESQIVVNGPVMGFSLAVTLATMVLFALFPAIESSRAEVNSVLQEGSRGTSGRRSAFVRSGLIVLEVAVSLVLLIAAGLLIRSLGSLNTVDPGFNTRNLLVSPIQLPQSRYPTSLAATAFYENALERIRTMPGVRAAAASTNVPFTNGLGFPLVVEGKTYNDLNDLEGLQFEAVMGDYFRTMGLRLVSGRLFEDTDRAGTPQVIILNEAAVKRFLPDVADPLGHRVMLGAPQHLITPGMLPPGLDRFEWATIVGVVHSSRHFGLFEPQPTPTAYIPVGQSFDFLQMRANMSLVLRTDGDPLAAVPNLRTVITSLDPDQPLGRIADMETIISNTLQGTRFQTILLVLFAAVALALAVVGIYGVVAWNVSQRTREIGIRQALGAQRRDVLRLVVGQAMRVVGIGVALGLVLSVGTGIVMRNLVFGISPYDPWTFVLVAVLLAGSALLACLLPARRATRIEPNAALRAE